MGVAGVEVEVGMGGKEGFALRSVVEGELIGGSVGVGGKDAAQGGAAEEVEIAQMGEAEAVGAGEFVRREERGGVGVGRAWSEG